MKRREFFQSAIAAATLPAAVGGCCRHGTRRNDDMDFVYNGEAFGTNISITIAGMEIAHAESRLAGAIKEMRRLESIFTLFEPQSPLRQLNRDGKLSDPPVELVEVLEICHGVNQLTDGAFDPTVQPLWDLYEHHFALNPDDEAGPSSDSIAETRACIGWDKVELRAGRIAFAKSGMAMTLNGIAPGYTADWIIRWLAERDVRHALADLGEFRALGTRPDGTPWNVGIRSGGEVVDQVGLVDNALATSSGSGTIFDLEGQFHHLFHPRRDQFSNSTRTISVEAPTAAQADALATAGGVMETGKLRSAVAGEQGIRVREFTGR